MAERPGNDPGPDPSWTQASGSGKQITWPISQFKMSLVGFDRTYSRPLSRFSLPPDLTG